MADNWIRQHLAGTLSLRELEQIRPKTSKDLNKAWTLGMHAVLGYNRCFLLWWQQGDSWWGFGIRLREGGKRGQTPCPLPGGFGQERKGMAALITLSLWLYNCFLVLPRQVRYAGLLDYFRLSSKSAYVHILIFLFPFVHLEYFFWRSLF